MTRISRRAVLGTVTGLATLAFQPSLARAASRSVVVRTSHGQVRGHVVDDIATFRGVRYGADTSARRFQPPLPPAPWTGVVDADEQGPASPQVGSTWPASEDCLFLNVWTPGCDATAKRPVMVYIHGGAYASGSCADPLCDGARLAARGDVVVVTLNHRLNALGYLYLARLPNGARVCRQRQLRPARSRAGAAVGSRQRCRVRRRSGPRDGVRPVGRRREDRDVDGDACRVRIVPSRRHDERPAGDCIRSVERDRACAQIPRGGRPAAGTLPRTRPSAARAPAVAVSTPSIRSSARAGSTSVRCSTSDRCSGIRSIRTHRRSPRASR